MEEGKMEMTSAAAFVEGGIQEACDDSCSICLEPFSDTDPSTVTGCKHEFHLQCILEWCQRSSQCPMCWQPISLKDPTSQELLQAVERERSIRSNQTRTTAIFHHPTLGDFELQHLPVGANDADLEERIMQHLAAAAAMGRAHHMARREGRSRSGGHNRPQFLVFSRHPNGPSAGSVSSSSTEFGEDNEQISSVVSTGSSVTDTPTIREESLRQVPQTVQPHVAQVSDMNSRNNVTPVRSHSDIRSSAGQTSPGNSDRAGPSDFQSFSENLKSRINTLSTKYKESFTKSTRGWKERLFSRSSSVADIGSEVRREVNAGIATVSRMMGHLETQDSGRAATSSITHSTEGSPVRGFSTEVSPVRGFSNVAENQTSTIQNDNNTPASFTADSAVSFETSSELLEQLITL